MGSMPLPLAPAKMGEAADDTPEVDDAGYMRQVLRQPEGVTEADLDRHLAAKATALGIDVPEHMPFSADKPSLLRAEPSTAINTLHARTPSMGSNGTASSYSAAPATPTTPVLDDSLALTKRRPRSINFHSYERYLTQVDPNLTQPKFVHPPPSKPPERAGSLFSVSSRRSVQEFRRSIASKLKKRKSVPSPVDTVACVCCREDFIKDSESLRSLPCGHTYCGECLAVMTRQAIADESKMPPRCCTQPLPSTIIKTVITRDEQQSFLRAVAQYSTPWETRIFCPNPTCNEFIPPRNKIDPKHPFQVVCKHCRTRVCIMCKRRAHRLGQDCPDDWELDAVLKMGEKSGWRRCYKCRALVELAQGCTHMTCRCKAQFCYICGGVWDSVVGCPNFCNGEEELERRRQAEEERLLELEAEEEAQKQAAAAEEAEREAAEKRTEESKACKALRRRQTSERERFTAFERKTRWVMWTRHSQKKLALAERHADGTEKMKERHAKTEQHLEDRQIEAEIELRAALEQSEKSIRIQLKYMEAYCHGLGRFADTDMPSREVTQKHLEQLGQQYHLRDGMERRHQSQINVLREKQAKRMEELAERHEKELEAFREKQEEEVEELAVEFANEEDYLARIFENRKHSVILRWELAGRILCKELQDEHGHRYLPVLLPEWPVEGDDQDDGVLVNLPAVLEETMEDGGV